MTTLWENRSLWTDTKYEDIDLSNAPQPPLKIRGGEGELCKSDRLLMHFLVTEGI